jgi:hypothetical protein
MTVEKSGSWPRRRRRGQPDDFGSHPHATISHVPGHTAQDGVLTTMYQQTSSDTPPSPIRVAGLALPK